jgi:uncharacterized RDD family membrane protein YckC
MEINETLDSAVIQQEQRVSERHIASGGKRFANYLIDAVIVYILMFLAGMGYVILTGSADIGKLESYLYGILVMIGYYTIMESIFGKTIGKMVTGTRVVHEDFSKPSVSKIFARSLCRLIPFEPLSCLGDRPTGWHDTIPDLWVIDERAMRQ